MPKDWAVCFMHDCFLKEQCLRYYAGKALPIGQHSTLTVLPSARFGNSCKEFYAMETERQIQVPSANLLNLFVKNKYW